MSTTKTYDVVTLHAAKIFSVQPDKVTIAMRSYAKIDLHARNYSAGPTNFAKFYKNSYTAKKEGN